MLKVNMTIMDGCSWSSYDLTMEFKNKKELDEYIECQAMSMDRVHINRIEGNEE